MRIIRKIRRVGEIAGAGKDLPVIKRKPGVALSRKNRMRLGFGKFVKMAVPLLSVVLLVALVVVPLLLLGWFVFFSDIFLVQAITVVDARDHTMKQVKTILDDKIDEVVVKRNIFFLTSDLLESAVLAELPQVRTVHIVRKLPGTVKAIVQEKEPALLLLSDGQYYFVDDNGIPYEEARLDTLPGVVLPIVKNDNRETRVVLGVAAVEPSFVTFMRSVQDKLPERAGAEVAEIHIPSLAAREVHYYLNNNWRILFDATRPFDQQIETLEQLLREVIAEEDHERLEYIDLRIPQRAYYRVTGGASSE
jgi:cell division septal protein FtsQ